MFKMASARLWGRRALIVESERDIALQIADDLRHSGGREVGRLPNVEAVLRHLQTNPAPDCIIIDVRQTSFQGRPVAEIFGGLGIDVVFVTGFDDWFLDEDEDEAELAPATYAHG